jgi:hypothetical protein
MNRVAAILGLLLVACGAPASRSLEAEEAALVGAWEVADVEGLLPAEAVGGQERVVLLDEGAYYVVSRVDYGSLAGERAGCVRSIRTDGRWAVTLDDDGARVLTLAGAQSVLSLAGCADPAQNRLLVPGDGATNTLTYRFLDDTLDALEMRGAAGEPVVYHRL